MLVRIPQAGRQGFAPPIDQDRTRRRLDRAARPHGGDLAIGDQHRLIGQIAPADRIEHQDVVNQGRGVVGGVQKLVGDIAHHVGGGLVLKGLQLGTVRLIPFRQERDSTGIGEEMIVAVQPHRRGRKAPALDEGQLDRLWPLRSVDLHGLAYADAGMAGRQKIDALVARRDQRIDIQLARQPGAAIGVVTLGPEGRLARIDHGFPMRDARAIDGKVLGRVALIGIAANGDGGRPMIGAEGHQFLILGHPAPEGHGHAIGHAPV